MAKAAVKAAPTGFNALEKNILISKGLSGQSIARLIKAGVRGKADANDEPEPDDGDLDHVVLLPDAPLKTLAEYVAFMKAMAIAENPLSVMARRGMTPGSFGAALSAWSHLLGKDNRLALRYVELMRPEPAAAGSSEE